MRPWMRPNAKMQAVHELWGTDKGAGWDTHRGRAGLEPLTLSRSRQPPLCRAGAAPVRPFGPESAIPLDAERSFLPRFAAPCLIYM